MSVRSIVSRCIAACEQPRVGLMIHHAVEMGVPMVEEDDEARGQLIREGLASRIKSSITRTLNRSRIAEMAEHIPEQYEMWGLRPAYVLDGNESRVKRTRELTKAEFKGLIRLRCDQLAADRTHLGFLEAADLRVAPLWETYPLMTFGEVFDLWQELNREAAE